MERDDIDREGDVGEVGEKENGLKGEYVGVTKAENSLKGESKSPRREHYHPF